MVPDHGGADLVLGFRSASGGAADRSSRGIAVNHRGGGT